MRSLPDMVDAAGDQEIRKWIPEELGNSLGIDMPAANRNAVKPSNGNRAPRISPAPVRNTPQNKDVSTPQRWLPPELNVSLPPHLAQSSADSKNVQAQDDQAVAELNRQHKLISKAEGRVEEILRQAEQQAASIREDAYKQGLAAANSEIDQLLRTARTIVDETHAWRESMIAQSEETVINLVIEIGKTLFGAGFVLDSNKLKETYARAIRESKNLGDLVIRLHPEDADKIEHRWLQEQAHFSQSIRLSPDSSIKRGGCLIEGEFGKVDARVDSQFEIVTDRFNDVLAAQSTKNYTEQNPKPGVFKGNIAGDIGI